MTDKFKIKKSLHIEPKDLATITSPEEGDIAVDLSGDLNIYSSGSWGVATSIPNQNLSSGYENIGDFSTNSYSRVIPQFPWSNPTKLANPSSLPTGASYSLSWSPCGEFLAIADNNSTPFRLFLYQRSGTTFIKLPDLTLTSTALSCSWSPNGEFLAVINTAASPYINIYQRSGTTFTKLSNPVSLPNVANCCAWSSNGEFLVVGGYSASPFILIYQRSGTTFTKIADPAITPTSTPKYVTWSPDNRFLAVGHNTAPKITIYERSGTTFTKLANPSVLPDATFVYGGEFSPDGKFLVTSKNITDPLTQSDILIYERNGSSFTALPDFTGVNLALSYSLFYAWHKSGKYLACRLSSSPFIAIYQRSGNTFTKLSNPSILPPNASLAYDKPLGWSPTGEFFAFGHGTTPFITIYQTSSEMPDESVLTLPSIKRSGV